MQGRYHCRMETNFEPPRGAMPPKGYSVYEAIGIAIQSGLYARRLRVKDLAGAIGITSSVTSKKLRGDVAWSLTDIYAAAELLDIEPADLLPRREMVQAPAGEPGPGLRARRDSNPQPSDP